MNYSLPYKRIFGGVSSMRSDQFKRINGYPNRYWGWGGKIFFVDIFQILSNVFNKKKCIHETGHI